MKKLYLIILSSYMLCLGAEESLGKVKFSEKDLQRISTLSPLPEVPADPTNKVSKDMRAVNLGEKIFGDWRLSSGGEFACADCHRELDNFMTVRTGDFVDIPSLWNIGYNKWFFWDGRADSLWAQTLGPLEAAHEHNSTRTEIARLMSEDTTYKPVYEELFGKIPDFSDVSRFPYSARPDSQDTELNEQWLKMAPEDQFEVNRVFANVGKVLAAYQMTIVSPKTSFDLFVEGIQQQDAKKMNALTQSAQRGLKLFIGKGKCIDCHSGPTFSDNAFHDTGLPDFSGIIGVETGRHGGIVSLWESTFSRSSPFSDAPNESQNLADLKVDASHKNQYKTPSLRKVTLTPPYMHTGQFRFLSDVIEFYSTMKDARVESPGEKIEISPRNFTEQEKVDLLAFLKAISDRVP
jgi:cytochrome c peroxidase